MLSVKDSRKATITFAFVLLLGCVLQMGCSMVPGNENVSRVNTAINSAQPVLIQSDNDFITQGWPGNGNSVNPYVIQGLHFQSTQRPCVNISNVESDFVIRDCSFVVNLTEGYPISVSLLKVKQFLIANSTFNQGFIFVRNSTTCVFKGNNLTSNVPIEAWFCNHIELTDNHIAFSNQPIQVLDCGNLSACGNEIVGDGYVFADFRNAFEFAHNSVSGDLYFS